MFGIPLKGKGQVLKTSSDKTEAILILDFYQLDDCYKQEKGKVSAECRNVYFLILRGEIEVFHETVRYVNLKLNIQAVGVQLQYSSFQSAD